jgi:pilus assembly protein CpaB
MSRSARTLVVFSLSLAIAGAFSFLVYQAARQVPAPTQVQSYNVVVAARDLPMGTRLTAGDVRLVAWPSASPIANAVVRTEDAVNRGLLASVVANEPLTAAKLASPDAGAGLPAKISAGMRAISVKVDEVVGVAGFAVPGAHVDVVVTISQREQSIARVVVSNVEVLASGTRAEQAQPASPTARPTTESVVTLLVTPPDAERISLAASVGRITLTLRHPLDTSTTDTKGTQVAALLGAPEPAPAPAPRPAAPRVVRAPAPEPPPPPPPPYTVETIRAAKRTAEVVK